ncbi:2-oxoisovalerate dehydrogenase subunit alpha, mitochondrial [Porphyridium purpureum]|uniref:2-oxoisovalerate dehydrogenase subunit alpha n=1 Tax=Porphyridium purpureum TaxID=35688 RepID=A0A5J4YSZ1_PORPP|nr:2-oxoisovalerate dehydrogenase subunit alpha, mitochondrial [Porphyridium purpureum]|eukprot:POR3549..scf227_4
MLCGQAYDAHSLAAAAAMLATRFEWRSGLRAAGRWSGAKPPRRHWSTSSSTTTGPGGADAVPVSSAGSWEQEAEPKQFKYPGAQGSKFSAKFNVVQAKFRTPASTFRVLSEAGDLVGSAAAPASPEHAPSRHIALAGRETVSQMYKHMVQLRVMDEYLYSAQRQGRISFYMTSAGEEAAVIGTAAALKDTDPVFAQYREQGVLLWRGFTFQEFCMQCFGKGADKGRQMPVHYGSPELAFHTVSSPLATQLPQASGAAYALRLARKGSIKLPASTSGSNGSKKGRSAHSTAGPEDMIVTCFFGDGAASEGDFHAGLNFSATLGCPVLFVCRNNGFAISTPTKEQYRGDGVVMRGLGYGMDAVRVDGNDALAVEYTVREARKHIVEHQVPVLVELMTYRVGHHSTSDDSSQYREANEMQFYNERADPLRRLRAYMQRSGWWDDEQDTQYMQDQKRELLTAIKAAEKEPDTHPMTLFDDVYHELPPSLVEQRKELYNHLRSYPHVYKAAVHDMHV